MLFSGSKSIRAEKKKIAVPSAILRAQYIGHLPFFSFFFSVFSTKTSRSVNNIYMYIPEPVS